MATATLTRTRPHAYDDLLATPDDGRRYEIIDGEMIVSASPRLKHVWCSKRLYGWLDGFVTKHDVGVVLFAPVDVAFEGGVTVVPDLLFIRKDRLDIMTEAFIAAAPDLIIEILSPSTRDNDLNRKLRLYEREGVLEYWVADAVVEDVALWVLGPDGFYLRRRPIDGKLHSEVLPGLVLDVAGLFAGLPG